MSTWHHLSSSQALSIVDSFSILGDVNIDYIHIDYSFDSINILSLQSFHLEINKPITDFTSATINNIFCNTRGVIVRTDRLITNIYCSSLTYLPSRCKGLFISMRAVQAGGEGGQHGRAANTVHSVYVKQMQAAQQTWFQLVICVQYLLTYSTNMEIFMHCIALPGNLAVQTSNCHKEIEHFNCLSLSGMNLFINVLFQILGFNFRKQLWRAFSGQKGTLGEKLKQELFSVGTYLVL